MISEIYQEEFCFESCLWRVDRSLLHLETFLLPPLDLSSSSATLEDCFALLT